VKKHLIKLVTLITLIAIVGALVFTGCAEEEAPPVVEEEAPPVVEEEAPPVVEEAWQWPEKLAMCTAPGLGLAATTGWASELSKDTGVSVRCVPESNTQLKLKWVSQGLFFSTAEAATEARYVLEGFGGYAVRDGGPSQLRLLWANSVSDAGFIVRGDSDIKSLYDIKPGTRFVDIVFVPGSRVMSYGLLAWAGVDADDITWVPGGNFGACIRFISGGQADVCIAFPLAPEVMEAAAAPYGIRWLDFPYDEDPEGAKRYLEARPTDSLGVMSQTPECTGVRGKVEITAIMTRAETDPEMVYHWAKWIDENYDLYKDNHMFNQYMTIDNTMRLLETWFLPAHDGLIKYLKEKGLWTAAHDVRQAQNIELVTRYVEAYQEAIDMADEQGIMVTPENEEWVELWENQKQELGLPIFKMFLGLEE